MQGERDPFGGLEEVPGYKLSKQVRVVWIPDGDHSLTPRKASGQAEEENWGAAIGQIVGFLQSLPAGRGGEL